MIEQIDRLYGVPLAQAPDALLERAIRVTAERRALMTVYDPQRSVLSPKAYAKVCLEELQLAAERKRRLTARRDPMAAFDPAI